MSEQRKSMVFEVVEKVLKVCSRINIAATKFKLDDFNAWDDCCAPE